MKQTVRTGLDQSGSMDNQLIGRAAYTRAQADKANQAFDELIEQFLRDWIAQGTVPTAEKGPDTESDTETFIEQGALRSFFKHRDDALEELLDDKAIARHLLRPIEEVYFQSDAYEPLLSKFEQRIYNLAAHREHLEIPFRYSSPRRQGDHGDSVTLADMPAEEAREDIGFYFGTRRSNEMALSLLARQLRREAQSATDLPVQIVTDGYMEDSLRAVRTATEELRQQGTEQLYCFLIHRRHAADDRHLGAALLIMNPANTDRPQRVIFCDTLNPSGRPPWWDKFKYKLDTVFPQPADLAPVSDVLEDGGVKLQRLHDGVPVRHQDIDCAFYTFSIVRALIQLAKSEPTLLIQGGIDAIVSQMTARMPEYYQHPNQPKEPVLVREVNVVRRWNTGREALLAIRRSRLQEQYKEAAAGVTNLSEC